MSSDWGSLVWTGPNIFDNIIRGNVLNNAAAECNVEYARAVQARGAAANTEAHAHAADERLAVARSALEWQVSKLKVLNLAVRSHVARHTLQASALHVSNAEVARELGFEPNAPIRNLQLMAYRRLVYRRSRLQDGTHETSPALRPNVMGKWSAEAGLHAGANLAERHDPPSLNAADPFVSAIRVGLIAGSDIMESKPIRTSIHSDASFAAARYQIDPRWLVYWSRDLLRMPGGLPAAMSSAADFGAWKPFLNSAIGFLRRDATRTREVTTVYKSTLSAHLEGGLPRLCIPIYERDEPVALAGKIDGSIKDFRDFPYAAAGYIDSPLKGCVYLLMRKRPADPLAPMFCPPLAKWPSVPGEALQRRTVGDLRPLRLK